MTNNLDGLKQELLDYLASEEFAIFRGQPGNLEGLPRIYWDTEAYPEYQAYLNVAKAAGARVIVFAHRELDATDIDDAREQIQECELSRDEQQTIESTLNDLRAFAGSTCAIEMAFDYQGRLYVFELVTEWFQTFMEMSDLLMAASSADDDEDEDGPDSSYGGYYSKN